MIGTKSKILVHASLSFKYCGWILNSSCYPMFNISFGGWRNEKIPKQRFDVESP